MSQPYSRTSDQEIKQLKLTVEGMEEKFLNGVKKMFEAHEEVEHKTQAQLREIIDFHHLLLNGEDGRTGVVGDVRSLNDKMVLLGEVKKSTDTTEAAILKMGAGLKVWQWVITILLSIAAIGVSILAIFH